MMKKAVSIICVLAVLTSALPQSSAAQGPGQVAAGRPLPPQPALFPSAVPPRNYIAVLDLVSGRAAAWNPDADASIMIVAPHHESVYVGGEFSTLGGQGWPYLAALEPASPICHVRLNDGAVEYASVQAAVDASTHPTDVVKVAGYCAGVNAYGGLSQHVYLTKTLTIQGGYTTTHWTTPDPVAHPTTLDALGLGRVIYVAGLTSPTIAGLHITGGDAAGLGGDPYGADAGGGVYAISATFTLSNTWIMGNNAASTVGNTDSSGGGVCLWDSAATLTGNTIASNVGGWGGGLAFFDSAAVLAGNVITANRTHNYGGGLYIETSPAALVSNTIAANDAHWDGGGMYAWESLGVEIRDNTFQSNTAGTGGGGLGAGISRLAFDRNAVYSNTAAYGGGVLLDASTATLKDNLINANDAQWRCGGLYVYLSTVALTNTLVADNWAAAGGGVHIEGSTARWLHSTIARNSSGDGIGVLVIEQGSTLSAVAMTNTILVSHTVGMRVAAGITASLEATLWGNVVDWDGSGSIVSGTHNYWGNPAFVDPAAGDYHIGPASAALDRGIDAGVTSDIDGEPRPQGNGYDIGADELLAVLPPVLLSPADGTLSNDNTPTLAWQASTSATGYLLDLSGIISAVGNVTAYTPAPLADGVYTWSVAAHSAHYTSPYTDAWSFSLDATAPHVTAVDPPNGASQVTVTAPLVITFSEPIDAGMLAYTLTPNPGGLSVAWSNGGALATISHAPFAYSTAYTLSVTAADDLAGNPLSNAPYTWSFLTLGISDTIPPAVTAVKPPDGALGVAVDAPVVITFSEAVDTSTFTYTVEPDPAGWAAAWDAGGAGVTLSHAPFAYSTAYTLSVTAASDLAGNPLSDAPYAWSFATASAPVTSHRVYLPVLLK